MRLILRFILRLKDLLNSMLSSNRAAILQTRCPSRPNWQWSRREDWIIQGIYWQNRHWNTGTNIYYSVKASNDTHTYNTQGDNHSGSLVGKRYELPLNIHNWDWTINEMNIQILRTLIVSLVDAYNLVRLHGCCMNVRCNGLNVYFTMSVYCLPFSETRQFERLHL